MFGRNRRQKAEAKQVGEAFGALFQIVVEALERWRTGLMATRCALLAAAFDERIVQVEAGDGLTLAETLQIEATALLANYREWRPTYLGEALCHLDWDTVHAIDALKVNDQIREWVDEIVDKAGCELAGQLIEAGQEELARRGVAS